MRFPLLSPFSLFLSVALFCLLLPFTSAADSPKNAAPHLMQAKEFRGQNIRGWLMSEKLDGVRGFWDGRQLVSRNGYAFTPPPDFTRDFPPFALDGELFSGRGRFAEIAAALRTAGDPWQGIKLHVFDVPDAPGGLVQRLQQAKDWLLHHPHCRFTVIEQRPVYSLDEARRFLAEVEALGGEGVVFRAPDLPYQAGRHAGFLKWKRVFDDECTVVAHHPGRGKYVGLMGAVSCENRLGRFRIGSGWKDADRRNPPAIGTRISYRYRGFTKNGLPRFATYLRPGEDTEISGNKEVGIPASAVPVR